MTEPATRRRWVTWAAIGFLLALLALVVLHPALRGLAADTWREMLGIPPGWLALIFLLKVMQSLFSSLAWRNALLSAWPQHPLAYRFVLGVEQGQVAINTIAPARAGTWAMLGIFDFSIPGARPPKLLAVWGLQSLAFAFFAMVTYVLVAVGLPGRADAGGGVVSGVSGLVTDQPLLAAGIAVAVVAAAAVLAKVARRRLGQVGQQVREGLVILRTPARYLRLIFLPSLASYLFGCATYMVLLHVFGMPVTIWTVALALGSNALAGAVRITPGGLGTTQAIDVIALRDYAAPEVVTAYSLSEIAISAVTSSTIAVVALLSVTGWRGTRSLLLHLHRGDLAAGLHRLGDRRRALRVQALRRQRALKERVLQRRKTTGGG